MKRSGPLRRRKPLRARGRPRQVSAKRLGRIEVWFDRDTHARIRRRDGNCVAPGRGHPLPCEPGRRQVHHVKFKSRGGGDEDSNLVLVCPAHHRWIHAHARQAEAYDLARPASWQDGATSSQGG